MSLAAPSIHTCQSLVEEWFSANASELSPATLRRYQGCLHAFLHWFELAQKRSLQLNDLHFITLTGYRAAIQQTVDPTTVNTHLCALRSWCGWLEHSKQLPSNPATRLKLSGRPHASVSKALTPTQLNALLRQAQRTRYATRNIAIILMLVQTGLRIGECANLCFEDISFGERQGQVLVRNAKGSKTRKVPLNASVRQALADYVALSLEVEPTLKAVTTAWPHQILGKAFTPLWQSERHSQLSLREMSHTLYLLLEDCANQKLLPRGCTTHHLRHTFATAYLHSHPADLVGLARLLGHSSLDTTRIYVEPSSDELAERVETIELNIYAQ